MTACVTKRARSPHVTQLFKYTRFILNSLFPIPYQVLDFELNILLVVVTLNRLPQSLSVIVSTYRSVHTRIDGYVVAKVTVILGIPV